MHEAKLGDRVRVQYFRIPEHSAAPPKRPSRKSCEFTVGGSEVFPTLSTGVVGMAPGDQRQFTLQPLEAYGEVQPKLIRKIPRARFPQQLNLTVGKRLTAVHGVAGRRRVTVIEVLTDTVIVDGNHPLAGKVIELVVSLISVDTSPTANPTQPQLDLGG
jgi:FKBP-type peptidyl-prolyl cis-trans isomerase 2